MNALFGGLLSKKDGNRLLGSWALHIVSNIAKMLGDFCREGAVLLIVFVPLEMIRGGADNTLDHGLVWRIAIEGTVLLFVIGVGLEFLHILAARLARDLEKAYDPTNS